MAGRVVYEGVDRALGSFYFYFKHVEGFLVYVDDISNAHGVVLQFSLNFLLNCGIIFGCNQNLKVNLVVFLTPLPQLIVYLLCIHP